MKTKKFVIIFLLISNSAFAQNNFNLGVEFLKNGDYKKADSCLTIYIKQHPNDHNGIYNLSVTKLFLGDTCSFCKGLFSINYPFEPDKEALKLYFDICGYTDTIFYNKNNEVVSALKYKYFEVIEHHNCLDFIIGKYHLKKPRIEISGMNLGGFNTYKTDIYGVYHIAKNNNKVFIYGIYFPTLQNNNGSLQEILKQSLTYEKARNDLNLSGYTIIFSFIVKKDGRPSSIEIISSKPALDNKEDLLKYLNQMFKTVPNYTPAKYNGEYVNFKILEKLKF